VKVTAVAPAMMRHRDRVVLYVMYLCRKTMTMYCCVKTIWIVIDLCLELELSLFCCVNLLYVTCGWGTRGWGGVGSRVPSIFVGYV
jgi:hypothetical protein